MKYYTENGLLVKSMDDFFNKYASDKVKEYYNENTALKERTGRVVCLGFTATIHPEVSKEKIVKEVAKEGMKILKVLEAGIEENKLLPGALGPMIRLPLAKLSPNHREMVLFYPQSDLTREELNRWLKEKSFTSGVEAPHIIYD